MSAQSTVPQVRKYLIWRQEDYQFWWWSDSRRGAVLSSHFWACKGQIWCSQREHFHVKESCTQQLRLDGHQLSIFLSGRLLGIKKRHLVLITLDTKCRHLAKQTNEKTDKKPNNRRCFLVFWQRTVKECHTKTPLHNLCRLTMSVQLRSWSHFLPSWCSAQPPLSVCLSALTCLRKQLALPGYERAQLCSVPVQGSAQAAAGAALKLFPWFPGEDNGERGGSAQMGFIGVFLMK